MFGKFRDFLKNRLDLIYVRLHTNLLANNCNCINLQLPIVILYKAIILFAKSRKFHKFATTNRNLEKIDYFRHASSFKVDVHVYQFSAKSG